MGREYPNAERRKRNKWGKAVAVAAWAIIASGCSNIDCPLNSVVTLNCGLYKAEDMSALKITDTLSITARDTISLLNRATGISSFSVALSHVNKSDTLVLRFSSATGQSANDTLFVGHTNEPHFESIDCPPSVFHTINKVRWTSHSLHVLPLTIDSVSLSSPLVNYDEKENLKIFLRSTSGLPSAVSVWAGK